MCYYNKAIGNMTDHDAKLLEELEEAIEDGQLYLCYQPMVDMKSQKTSDVEALLRWRHPVKGTIGPMEFIPVAERAGLILPIGKWVLENACNQLKNWHEMGLKDIRIAVNISVVQLGQSDFVQIVTEVLRKNNLSSKYLEIEITETSCMNFADIVIDNLKKLSEIGIKVSIDDFGTGYNSLKNLQKFVAGKIKLDRIFISNIHDEKNKSIIDMVITLGHQLGMQITAEGIENEEQYEYLLKKGCDIGQGYYFCRPLIPEHLLEYIGSTV